MTVSSTVVAQLASELIRFGPEVCICNGYNLKFKGESISVTTDFLLTFPQICLCNGS